MGEVMESEKFNLVFKGEILPRQDVQEVKQNMASLFKLPMATVEKLFSGQPIVLKKSLDLTAANRYRVAIKKAGARVNLVKTSVVCQTPQANTAEATQSSTTAVTSETKAQLITEESDSAVQEDEKPAFELLEAGCDLLREDERTTAHWVPLEIDLSHLSLKENEGNLLDKGEIDTPAPIDVVDIDADILPAGSDLLPESERKVTQPIEIDDLALDIAPAGTTLAPAKPQVPPLPINVDHIQLAE